MIKSLTNFRCTNCSNVFSKWMGQCSNCKAWNTIVEEKPLSYGSSGKILTQKQGNKINFTVLNEPDQEPVRKKTNIQEFDRVIGGGLVPGSAILVGGDPGIGKSTLLLQVASSVASAGLSTVYISGEEAPAQIRMRAKRLKKAKEKVRLASETNLRDILTTIQAEKVDLLIIDSIQTMWIDNIDSSPGSVSQVRSCALELTKFAKNKNTAVIMVGHVTKDGQIAGPKLVEHMVDTVLYFEGERGIHFRIIRSVKNRFGPSNEIGVFEMTGEGLAEVTNPSELFMSNRNIPFPGSVVFAALEGSRPVLVELQALVVKSSLASPRRSIVGWDNGRLAMILAVLDSRCGINLSNMDVYLNVAGGIRITEPAADLAVASALLSAYTDIKVPSDTVIFGELSLSGAIRHVPYSASRLKEIKKLGFSKAIIPYETKLSDQIKIQIHEFKNLITFVKEVFRFNETEES